MVLSTSLNGAFSSPSRAAQRVLASASRRLTSIKNVMAILPTYSVVTNANSTILTTRGVTDALYGANNPKYFQYLGGPAGAALAGAGNNGAGVTIASVYQSATTRRGGHGSGFATITNAPDIDFGFNGQGASFTIYVTDLLTGVRARAAANDFTTQGSGAFQYHKLAFGSEGLRKIEFYPSGYNSFWGCNVAAGYTLWAPCEDPGQAKIAIMWDSWGDGGGSGNTNASKLTITDFMGERLGCANPVNLSVASTGFIAPGSVVNFETRLNGGDADAARIGMMDVFIIPGSLNDRNGAAGGSTDAAIEAKYPQLLAKARAAQPGAIIVGMGANVPANLSVNQARQDALKRGWETFAATDTKTVYIDPSPTGDNWTYAGWAAKYLGPELFHSNDAGMPYFGHRIADRLIDAIQKKWG